MARFILSQGLKLITTLLFVIVAFYFLIQLSPYDPIQTELELLGVDQRNDPAIAQNIYNDLYTKNGYNQAPFYFDIVPSYYPDDYSSFSDPFIQEGVIWGLRQRIPHLEIMSLIDIFSALRKNGNACVGARTRFLLDAIAEDCLDKSSIKYEKLRQEIVNKKATWFWPKLRVHGTSNQFHRFFKNIFLAKIHYSKVDGKPVRKKISQAFMWTLALSLLVLPLCLFITIVLSYYQNVFRGGVFDLVSTSLLNLIYIIPVFLLCGFFILFFSTPIYSTFLHWFPTVDVLYFNDKKPLSALLSNSKYLILPALILILHYTSLLSRIFKTSIDEESKSPYVPALRSKGLTNRRLLKKHILPNSLFSLTTLFVELIPASLSGALIVEELCNIPGMGRLLYRSLEVNDHNVTVPLVLLITTITLLSYFLGDILYHKIDPRISTDTNTEARFETIS